MSMSEERNLGELPEAHASSFKIILGLTGLVVGLAVLVCGGVAGYVALTTAEPPLDPRVELARNPEHVRELAQKIAIIDIPDGLKPIQGDDRGDMTRVTFGREPGDGALLKMSRSSLAGRKPGESPRYRISMMLQMLEMGDDETSTTLQPGGNSPETTQELPVLGKNFPFRFIQGKLGEREIPVRKVVGGFATKSEIVVLICTLPEAEFDEAAILKMIASIRHPRGEEAVNPDLSDFDDAPAPGKGADVKSPQHEPGEIDAQTEGREKPPSESGKTEPR